MNNKLIPIVMTLVVGIILAGSVLMPVIKDAQTDIGPTATVTNEKIAGANYNYAIWGGENITFEYESTETTATYTINGEAFNLLSSEQRIILASNDFAARSGGNDTVYVLNSQYVASTTQFNNTDFTFEIVDKQYTLTVGADTYTGTVDWLVYAADDGDANLIQLKSPTSPFYTSNANDIIVLGNIYTTGENDTFYSYYKGQLTVNEAYADESNITITKTDVSGYTDIYATTVSLNIDDESFTPFFILAPENVSGHEASGAAYSLIGVLPVLVIVALLVVAIGVVARRND